MKLKIYIFLSFVMLALAGCSSDDDDDENTVIPQIRDSYVSRIKVADMNAPGSEPKTIKVYYDTQKRVTGIHWGTTVPHRNSWKIEYAADRVKILKTGDAAGTARYYTADAEGRASQLFYDGSGRASDTFYTYSGNRIDSIAEYFNQDAEPSVTSHFTWSAADIIAIDTHIRGNASDSLAIRSDIIYDEFAPNTTNIDLNIVLDAINGIIPAFEEVPLVLKKCGTPSVRLVLRHKYSITDCTTQQITQQRNYQVLGYSLQEGRLTSIETLDEADARHLKISIIYKSDK